MTPPPLAIPCPKCGKKVLVQRSVEWLGKPLPVQMCACGELFELNGDVK